MKYQRLGTTAQILAWNIDAYAVINRKLTVSCSMDVYAVCMYYYLK